MASTELERSPSSSSNRKTYTFSAWVKRSKISSSYPRIFSHDYADTDRFEFFFYNTDEIQIEHVNNNSTDIDIHTTRRFRDTNAWYHIVLAVDTTQSTAADRVKLYINGVQETVLTNAAGSSPTYPTQDSNTIVNYASGSKFIIGETGYSSGGQNFDGYMSHVHFCDGSALAPTVFGETDSTTGEWKIKTDPSFTPGTNGFSILKDGNTITDQSANSNDFTLAAGTLTKSQDCPSNIFNTWNNNVGSNIKPGFTFSNGNTTLAFSTPANDSYGYSTLGASSGKYYAEFKMAAFSNNTHYIGVKFHETQGSFFNDSIILRFAYTGNTNAIYSGFTGGFLQSNLTSLSAGDIIGIAVDLDNGTVDFTRNGSAYGSQITGQTSNFAGKTMQYAAFGEGHGSQSGRTFTINANFGNGYFGTTAVATNSGNGYQDADGNGIFNYTVPTNYRALCTKGLNQ